VQLEAHARPEPGATVAVAFDMDKMHAFDAESGAAL